MTQLTRLNVSAIVGLTAPLAAFVLGVWAQRALDKGDELTLAAVLYCAAAALFAFATWHARIEGVEDAAATGKTTALRLPLVALSLLLSALAFFQSGDNRFRLFGVTCWIGSLLVYLLALPHAWNWGETWARVRGRLRAGVVVHWQTLALVGITAVGAFLRFYQLDAIPAEMGPDLPLKYANIQEILKGNLMIFFPSHPGREAFFFYWAALFAKFFGSSHLEIKFTAALTGTLTLPMIYLVAKRLYNAEVGLYAALILAVSHWHIILSRIGFRAILVPFFVFALIYLTARALDHQRDWDFALCGLWLGLGLYTYNAWFLAPVAFVFVLGAYWLARRTMPLRSVVRFVLVAGIAALLVWAPLARYGTEHPEMYFKRVATRLTSEEQPLPPNVVEVFADNLKRTFLMLNYRGDPVFVQNVPFLRELNFLPAILFVLGLGYLLVQIRRGYNTLTLIFFALMLLPSALSVAFPAEVPNDVRSSGGIGMAILIAALPLALLRQRLTELLPSVGLGPVTTRVAISPREEWRIKGSFNLGTNWLIPAFAFAILWVEAQSSFKAYFTDYVFAQPAHNYSITRELAQELDGFAGNGQAFVKIFPYWYDGNALRVLMQRQPKEWRGELDRFDANAPPFVNFKGKALFLIHPQDKEALVFLTKFFPQGIVIQHRDSLGEVQFLSFIGQK